LLIDCSFQFSLLARTLVMTRDRPTLLDELHDLSTLPAIGPFRVDCPIASDIGRRLLRDHDIADHEQQEGEVDKKQFRAVSPHRVL
jgi:hypothetical protein